MSRLPQGFIAQLRPLLGSGLHDFINSFELPPHRGIRFSKRREPPFAEGLLGPVPWAEGAYYLAEDSPAGSHPLHDAGAYYLQEPSAMAAVGALDPKPGELLLDLCAAPGGKASQAADLMGGQGALLANEIHPARARILARNMERMGIPNAAVSCESPARLAEKLPRVFDKILVDAPCSGEGMFRREPDSRAQWRPESPDGCALRQGEILRSAARLLRPGGRMVYSTCTFNMAENEGVIERFLKDHPEFRLLAFALPGLPRACGGMLRIWPHLHRGEGHCIALMAKAEGADSPAPVPREPESSGSAAFEEINALLADWAYPPVFANHIAGNTAFFRAPALPDLSGLRLVSPGFALAQRQGKTWLPAHALALAGRPRRVIGLDEAQALRYQQGHPLPVAESFKGWAAPALDGWPLGWGKAGGGTLKNHLPKGLRRPL